MRLVAAVLIAASFIFAQQVDWIRQVMNKPVFDTRQYNFSPISTPGPMTATVPYTVNLGYVPLGVNGADIGHSLYLACASGAPEAVLITGGTAVGGQGGQTLTFVPAGTHAGPCTLSSGTAGIQEAINALPPGYTGGGTVSMPCGVINLYAGIGIGDGTSTSLSSKRNIALRGCSGVGATTGELGPAYGGTVLNWAGPPNAGAVISVNGPIVGVTVADMVIVCGPLFGATNTLIGLQVVHSINGTYERLATQACSYFSITDTAYNVLPAGVAAGGTHNVFQQIVIDNGGVPSSSGILVGAATYGDGVGISRDEFRLVDVLCKVGGTGVGVQLQFTDAGVIDHLESSDCLYDIFVYVPSGQPAPSIFPDAYQITNSYLLGVNSTGVGGPGLPWKPLFPIQIWPLNSTTQPAYGSGFVGFQGTDGGLQTFGYPLTQTTGADVASSSTIATTGGQFRITGTTPVVTIALPYATFDGCITLIPTAALPFTTGGNIAVALTATPNVPVLACYVPAASKWYLK